MFSNIVCGHNEKHTFNNYTKLLLLLLIQNLQTRKLNVFLIEISIVPNGTNVLFVVQ